MRLKNKFIVKRRFIEAYWLSIISIIGIFGSGLKLYYLEDKFYLFSAILFLFLLPLSVIFAPKHVLMVDDAGIKIGTYTYTNRYKLIKWEDIESKDNYNIKLRNGPWFYLEEFCRKDLRLTESDSLTKVDNEITRRLAIRNQTSKDILSVG